MLIAMQVEYSSYISNNELDICIFNTYTSQLSNIHINTKDDKIREIKCITKRNNTGNKVVFSKYNKDKYITFSIQDGINIDTKTNIKEHLDEYFNVTITKNDILKLTDGKLEPPSFTVLSILKTMDYYKKAKLLGGNICKLLGYNDVLLIGLDRYIENRDLIIPNFVRHIKTHDLRHKTYNKIIVPISVININERAFSNIKANSILLNNTKIHYNMFNKSIINKVIIDNSPKVEICAFKDSKISVLVLKGKINFRVNSLAYLVCDILDLYNIDNSVAYISINLTYINKIILPHDADIKLLYKYIKECIKYNRCKETIFIHKKHQNEISKLLANENLNSLEIKYITYDDYVNLY